MAKNYSFRPTVSEQGQLKSCPNGWESKEFMRNLARDLVRKWYTRHNSPSRTDRLCDHFWRDRPCSYSLPENHSIRGRKDGLLSWKRLAVDFSIRRILINLACGGPIGRDNAWRPRFVDQYCRLQQIQETKRESVIFARNLIPMNDAGRASPVLFAQPCPFSIQLSEQIESVSVLVLIRALLLGWQFIKDG